MNVSVFRGTKILHERTDDDYDRGLEIRVIEKRESAHSNRESKWSVGKQERGCARWKQGGDERKAERGS